MKRGPILLVGSLRDPTFRHSVHALNRQGRDFEVLEVDRFCEEGDLEGRLDAPSSLIARHRDVVVRFGRFRSCYARFAGMPAKPEAQTVTARQSHYRVLQLAIAALDVRVVNRPGTGESNDSKPYQTSLLQRHGFQVPRSCSTNLPETAEDFVQSCPRGAIYKSNSGERSIVQSVTPEDFGRLPLLPFCPVFFQERIWGADIRVHVVHDRCYGVLIRSAAVDYRYDRSGSATERPFEVPADLAIRCVEVTRALDLEFSGIDLIRSDDDGEFYCLEVNPMPGYHGYDFCVNFAISNGLGELLSQ